MGQCFMGVGIGIGTPPFCIEFREASACRVLLVSEGGGTDDCWDVDLLVTVYDEYR